MADWQDRRGMFQRGRELHDGSPGYRRASEASANSVLDALTKTTSNTSQADSTTGTAAAGTSSGDTVRSPVSPVAEKNWNPSYGAQQRRRSSAASGYGSGLFANLTEHKRGSSDYATRRSSHQDMEVGSGGWLGSMWNSTFRGVQAAKDGTVEKAKEIKRGVME